MSLFRRFSVVVVAFVLAGMSPALAQDIPDDATRAHVAEWLDQCSRNASDACMPVIKRIEDSPMFGYCQAIEWSWDAARLVRDPENAHFVDEAVGRREKAREFIAKCVPIYAAALDEAGEGDDSSGDTAYRGPVEAADGVMQAVKRSNLRGGPGTTYGKVGLLDIGDEVRVTGVVGDWLRIAAPDGGVAFIYGPLLAEVTPDQGTTAVQREPERQASPVIALEPKCAGMPAGARCWEELAERPGCHVWRDHYLPGYLKMASWSGSCRDGVVDGEGTLSVLEGQHYSEGPATFSLGKGGLNAGARLLPVRHPNEQVAEAAPDQGTTAVVGRDPDDAPPSGNSEQACDWWEVPITAIYTDFTTNTKVGGATKAEAEDEAQNECRIRMLPAPHETSCTVVGEATCVQPRSHAQQPGPPGETPGADTPSVDVPSGTGPLHGSIAFSQEDDGGYAWGIAWSFDSSAGAQAEAIGQCREYGGTQCAEAGWFQEACGALAIGSGNGSGTGWGATTAEAERDALRQCRARLNDDCRIEVARCSRSEEAGGAGRMENMDTAAGHEPDDASEQSCRSWWAIYTVTTSFNGTTEAGAPGLTPQAAQEEAMEDCGEYAGVIEQGSEGREWVRCGEIVEVRCQY